MRRRTYLASFVVTGGAVAGCLQTDAAQNDSSSPSPDTDSTSRTSSTTTTPQRNPSATATASANVEGTSAADSAYNHPYRFRVENRAARQHSITVTIAELGDDGDPTDEETTRERTLDPEERVSYDEYISADGSYEVTVAVEGGASDSWRIYDYVTLEVRITDGGELDPLRAEV